MSRSVTLEKGKNNMIGISIGGGAPFCPVLYIVQVGRPTVIGTHSQHRRACLLKHTHHGPCILYAHVHVHTSRHTYLPYTNTYMYAYTQNAHTHSHLHAYTQRHTLTHIRTQVFHRTPAYDEGSLAPGDELVTINGTYLKGLTRKETAELIQNVKVWVIWR